MASLQQKIMISLNSAVLFFIVNYPNFFEKDFVCPKNIALIVNVIIFFGISFLTMGNSKINTGVKIKHSLYSSLIFYFISSPPLYALVGSVFGKLFSDSNGCGTVYGLLLHTVVYCCALVAVMYLP